MKKNFLGLAAIPMLALLATSCAQETVETKGGDNVLTYGVATGKQVLSRAAEVDVDDLVGGFTATVRYTDDGAAYDVFTVKNEGAGWVYGKVENNVFEADVVYHPVRELVHYAVVPNQTYSDGLVDGSSASFFYSVGGINDQVDLIAASDKTQNTSATAATANLVFKHLLSQVKFTLAQPTDTNLTAEVTDLSINAVNNNGLFTINAIEADADGFGAWSLVQGTASYDCEVNATESLMLMPQEFVGETATFSFNYTVKDENNVVVRTNGATKVSVKLSDLTFGTGDDAKAEWEMGKKYNYTINFQDPVVLSYEPTVELWEEGGSGQVNI